MLHSLKRGQGANSDEASRQKSPTSRKPIFSQHQIYKCTNTIMFVAARQKAKSIVDNGKSDDKGESTINLEGNLTFPFASIIAHHITALPESYTISQLKTELIELASSENKDVS